MTICCLHDKKVIEQALRKNVYLNIYGIGDLDEFFWPYTIWYAEKTDSEVKEIALLYFGMLLPTLLAITDRIENMVHMIQSVSHLLPNKFYAHLSPGVEQVFKKDYSLDRHGEYLKMGLINKSAADEYDCGVTEALGYNNLKEISEFYKKSYPGNWFDPRMLETNQYFGIKENDALVSMAGVHVYSEEYKVAALGNISTLPSYRNRGYAAQVTARTCESLLETVEHIGLNVDTENIAAISCYKKLGFEPIASYNEYMVERK